MPKVKMATLLQNIGMTYCALNRKKRVCVCVQAFMFSHTALMWYKKCGTGSRISCSTWEMMNSTGSFLHKKMENSVDENFSEKMYDKVVWQKAIMPFYTCLIPTGDNICQRNKILTQVFIKLSWTFKNFLSSRFDFKALPVYAI